LLVFIGIHQDTADMKTGKEKTKKRPVETRRRTEKGQTSGEKRGGLARSPKEKGVKRETRDKWVCTEELVGWGAINLYL